MRAALVSKGRPAAARALLATMLGLAGCSGGQATTDGAALVDPTDARPALEAGATTTGAGGHPADSCNGATFMGTPVGAHCYPGIGACGVTGTVMCMGGSTAVCSATPGQPDESFHTSAAPNGSWDWNCNNGVDRKYPLATCESAAPGSCPLFGYEPAGNSGDCGQMLIQKACSPTGSGCVSSGSGQTVTEACK